MSTQLYQAAAVDDASHVGLLIAVYDAIARELFQSARAVREGNVGSRCAAAKRIFLLLGHLESWLGSIDEIRLAESLASFYGMLRTRLLQLQTAPKAQAFEDLARLVLDTRAAWQQLKQQAAPLTQPGTYMPAADAKPLRNFVA